MPRERCVCVCSCRPSLESLFLAGHVRASSIVSFSSLQDSRYRKSAIFFFFSIFTILILSGFQLLLASSVVLVDREQQDIYVRHGVDDDNRYTQCAQQVAGGAGGTHEDTTHRQSASVSSRRPGRQVVVQWALHTVEVSKTSVSRYCESMVVVFLRSSPPSAYVRPTFTHLCSLTVGWLCERQQTYDQDTVMPFTTREAKERKKRSILTRPSNSC